MGVGKSCVIVVNNITEPNRGQLAWLYRYNLPPNIFVVWEPELFGQQARGLSPPNPRSLRAPGLDCMGCTGAQV